MSEPIGEARVLILPDLTAFRAALTTGLAKEIASVQGAAAAQLEKAGATRKAAVADQQAAGAAANNAAANRLAAKAAIESAAAHEQLARGATASVLSLGGVRGATLAASKSFLIGAAAVTIGAKAVKESSAEAEANARVQAILGEELGKQSEQWAKQQAAIGLSATAALKFEGAIAEVFHNVGVASEQTAQFSERLVALSEDVAAFNNTDPEQVLRAFQLGLSGNLRGLRQFVPGVTAARVALQAMADTGKTTKASLTDQELTVARYEVILQAASNQVGTFARRQGDLAAQTKILESNLSNLGARIGGFVIPVLGRLAHDANILFSAFDKLSKVKLPGDRPNHTGILHLGLSKLVDVAKSGGVYLYALDQGAQALDRAFNLTSHSAQQLGHDIDTTSSASARLRGLVGQLGPAFEGLTGPLLAVANAFNLVTAAANAAAGAAAAAAAGAAARVSALQESLTQLKIVGAGSPQQIANLNKQIAQQRTIIQHPPSVAARRAAREAVLQAKQQIDAIKAADAAAAAAAGGGGGGGGGGGPSGPTPEEIASEADQALQTAQQLAQGDIELLKLKARRTKSLVDDIRASQAELALVNKQSVEARKIHDANTRLQTIQQLALQAEQAKQDIINFHAEQLQRARQRALDRADALVAIAGLDAQIAEVEGHKKDQIRALERQNRALEAERKLWRGNTQKQKELTLAIAENRKAIKDLRKETTDRADAFRALTFTFLQTQQGFAATLLSNLLPTSALAGTVGGSAISTPTASPVFGGGGREQVRDGLSAAGQVSAGVRGASSGQMATLIQIQRASLAALHGVLGRTSHPEATNQKIWQATEMLNTGW